MNSFQQFQPQLFLISENVSCHKLLSTLSVSFHGTLCPQKPYKLLGMGKGRDWVEMKAHSSATTCKAWRIVIHHKNNNVKEVRTPPVKGNLRTSLIAVPTALRNSQKDSVWKVTVETGYQQFQGQLFYASPVSSSQTNYCTAWKNCHIAMELFGFIVAVLGMDFRFTNTLK